MARHEDLLIQMLGVPPKPRVFVELAQRGTVLERPTQRTVHAQNHPLLATLTG